MADDIKIKCQDCGEIFTFTQEEQRFYEEKGFTPPKRCKNCRKARKERYNKQERR